MIFLHTLLLAAALASSMQEMFREYRLQLKACDLYEQRAYSQAEAAFRHIAAVISMPQEKAVTSFNLACALYMQGKYAEAEPLFGINTAPDSDHREIRMKALFNEGNTLAMRALGSKAKAEKTALFRQSLNRFKRVLINDPYDGDAKINYEIVRRYLYELDMPQPSSSSGLEKKSSAQPASGIGKDVAQRLLDNARQDESSLMQQLSQKGRAASQETRNTRDW